MNSKDLLTLQFKRLWNGETLEQKGDVLTFLFVAAGVGEFTSAVAEYRLAQGDVLVFHGAAGAKLSVCHQRGKFSFWTFSICFESLMPLFAGDEISLLQPVVDTFKLGKIYPAGSPLAAECHQLLKAVPFQYNLDHHGQLLRIAATVLAAEFSQELSRRTLDIHHRSAISEALGNLSAAELITLHVGELANRFSCSRRHLNRLFHERFGVSPAALRMEMRLLKAAALLRDASATVVQVARQCGFKCSGSFNKCFRRRFGANPGKWRKSPVSTERQSSWGFEAAAASSASAAGAALVPGGAPPPMISPRPGAPKKCRAKSRCQPRGTDHPAGNAPCGCC